MVLTVYLCLFLPYEFAPHFAPRTTKNGIRGQLNGGAAKLQHSRGTRSVRMLGATLFVVRGTRSTGILDALRKSGDVNSVYPLGGVSSKHITDKHRVVALRRHRDALRVQVSLSTHDGLKRLESALTASVTKRYIRSRDDTISNTCGYVPNCKVWACEGSKVLSSSVENGLSRVGGRGSPCRIWALRG